MTALLAVDTTPIPNPGSWADCVGSFDGATQLWLGPNGVTNFNDVTAVLDQFQQRETNPVTWTDIAAEVPNYNTNFADITAAIQGFQSQDYWNNVPDHDSIDDCVIPTP